MVAAAGKQFELDSIRRSPHAPPSASRSDRPPLHRRERSSLVKNGKREICTSGSVRGRGGNIPTYSAQGQEENNPNGQSATFPGLLLPHELTSGRPCERCGDQAEGLMPFGSATTTSRPLRSDPGALAVPDALRPAGRIPLIQLVVRSTRNHAMRPAFSR